MDQPIKIRLLGQPRGKAKSFSRWSGGYNDKQTQQFLDSLAWSAKVQMIGRAKLIGPIKLKLDAHMEIPKSWSRRKQNQALLGLILPISKPDLDNICKMADALKGIVWGDDSQICELNALKRYSDLPALYLEISEMLVDSGETTRDRKAPNQSYSDTNEEIGK